MAEQIVINLEKPETVKDGFNVDVQENLTNKEELNITLTNQTEAKIEKEVSIPNSDNPKTW